MFHLMNAARIHTGVQAEGCSSAAYMHAVTYARNRVQSALITNPKGGPVAIIHHPDVKRMLLYMKSTVEGMRMLCLFLALHEDVMHASKDPEEVKAATGIVEILTPIVKAGISDAPGWSRRKTYRFTAATVTAGNNVPFTAQYYTTGKDAIDHLEVWYNLTQQESKTVNCPWTTSIVFNFTSTTTAEKEFLRKSVNIHIWNRTGRIH